MSFCVCISIACILWSVTTLCDPHSTLSIQPNSRVDWSIASPKSNGEIAAFACLRCAQDRALRHSQTPQDLKVCHACSRIHYSHQQPTIRHYFTSQPILVFIYTLQRTARASFAPQGMIIWIVSSFLALKPRTFIRTNKWLSSHITVSHTPHKLILKLSISYLSIRDKRITYAPSGARSVEKWLSQQCPCSPDYHTTSSRAAYPRWVCDIIAIDNILLINTVLPLFNTYNSRIMVIIITINK